MPDWRQLEAAVWAIADGCASAEDESLFAADERVSLELVDQLISETEEDLASVRRLPEDERHQVVADFLETLASLRAVAARLRPVPPEAASAAGGADAGGEPPPEPVRLQASWAAGQVVVWAGGRGAPTEPGEAVSARIAAVGGPPLGWQPHRGVTLPGGVRAEGLSIGLRDALGWLVALAAAPDEVAVAPSLAWLGRAALEGVRLVARGSIVPGVRVAKRAEGRLVDAAVRWSPALLDTAAVDALAGSMPGAMAAAGGGDGRAVANAVIAAVVEAVVAESVERMELPASPPTANTATDLDDTVIARMDGSPFRAPVALATDMSRGLHQWSRSVTATPRTKVIVELSSPDSEGVWLVSVLAAPPKGKVTAIDAALRAETGARPLAAEWARLNRLFPALARAGMARRGTVALSQDEAWRFLTTLGPMLAAVGFEVRAPLLSRRKPKPSLRLFADAPTGTVVGARDLSNVAWSVLFDDVELSAADIRLLARQARPLVQSRGRWVEVDRADLEQAAAALAERESITSLTGAEILRHSIGLDGSGLAGGVVVHGHSWANDILSRAEEASRELITQPEGFSGTLRTYQAEALAWLGFLDAAELGGCLALDMGLGKTPTVLAHVARTAGAGPALVIAPAAVVGNWAAEAKRFAPGLRVVVHHGASRATAADLARDIAGADVVITTYATAVRDVDALAEAEWARVVLDEAQAIKNPANETSQQLRRVPARSRLALTGTPIENGLGDLWAILDFTNPGLVGTRPSFIAQMAGDGEAALKALNGILLFRRTKTEPEVAAELPDKIDELDHCTMTPEQIGLYQAVLDQLVTNVADPEFGGEAKKGAVLAAITALKQICNHPAAYRDDGQPLAGRSGKLARLEELVESVFAAGERILVFTHFASWGRRLAQHLSEVTGLTVSCYDGSLPRGVRDGLVAEFQSGEGPGAMVLSLKAGGTGLNLTAANHVVLYDRWWNPAVEDQARDRAWRIGQNRTVISHRLVCPGTVDERVEEVVEGKRHIANLVLPRSSSLADLNTDQLRLALGLRPDELLAGDDDDR
ncbi:MAG: DEAD/DEAH box helicase [Acidimicrobiales bacterium]